MSFNGMKTSDQYIKKLIAQGEHQQLDFKFEISDAYKIARTFSAFANTDGGKLLIGVKDNGRVAGVRSEEEFYMAESAATLYCKPEVPFTTQKWTVEGRTVLEITIPPSDQKPHFARDRDKHWWAYIRVKDENTLAHPVMLKVWKLRKSREGILVQYSNTEKILLDYLAGNPEITISRFMRIARINRPEAENVLARLIFFNVLSLDYSKTKTVYKLKSKGTPSTANP